MVETSVIMATYKESIECLKQSIESIINQTYNDFEFIIILDNPDNKEHIAFINDYVCKDERIKFYINDKNMGLTNTLNRGLELAEGKYICRMDADDISELYRMEHQKKYLEENDFDLIDLINTLKAFPNLIVVDDTSKELYPMAIDATGHDEVFVGRIRRDNSVKSGVNLWVVADNIRKGAASNAVQILQKLIENK